MQPLSLAVSLGNESYNANNPSASCRHKLFTKCAHAACSSCGYYSRVPFISLRAPDCVATIFVGGYYSRVASIRRNMMSQSIILHVIAN